MRNKACESHTWNQLISDVYNGKKYHKRKCSKSNKTKRESDNTQKCPKNEIDNGKDNGKDESIGIIVPHIYTWEIPRNKKYHKSGRNKLGKIFHMEREREVYTILPFQIFAKIISLC